MPVRNRKPRVAYALTEPLATMSPEPIVSLRAPTTRDFAEIGTVWVDTPNQDSYILVSVVANIATWINTGGGGGIFNSITVGPGAVTFSAFGFGVLTSTAAGVIASINGTNGQFVIGATGAAPIWASLVSGDGSVNIIAGANTMDLRVTGALAITFTTDAGVATPVLGDTDILGGTNINTAGAADVLTINVDANPTFAGGLTVAAGVTTLTSNTNAARAIYLHANGGPLETIQIHADQGTLLNSIDLISDGGGILITTTTLANDDAIRLNSVAGGIELEGALQIRIDSSEAAANAIVINASNAGFGGIDVDAGNGGITIDSTGAFSIDGATASNVTVANAGANLTLSSTLGRVIVNGEEAVNNAVTLLSAAGGLDVNVALQMDLDSSQAAANAIRIISSNAAGGIDVDAGTGGIAIDTTGGMSLNATTASDFTVTGAGADLSLLSVTGSVVLDGGEAAVDSITIAATNAAGGVDIDSGTGGIDLASAGVLSMDAQGITNLTTTGAFDLTIQSTLGSVLIDGGEAVADSINIDASNAAGGIDIDSGTGGVTIDSTGSISIDSTAASNMGTAGAGIDLTLASAAGRVIVNGEEAVANAITLLSAAGGIDVDAALQINIDSSQASDGAIRINASNAAGGINMDDGGGGTTIDSVAGISIDAAAASNFSTSAGDITLAATTNSVEVIGAEAVVDAVLISATNAAGGITLDTGPTPGVTLNNGTQTAQILVGTGSPDGVVTAVQGSMFLRTNGTAATTIYVNTDGAMAWTALS